MQLRLSKGLPFVQAEITFRGQSVTFNNVVVDTGSAGSVFSVDKLLAYVFSKRVERIAVDSLVAENLIIQVGAVNYGFEIDGLLGMNFLLQIGAVLDLAQPELRT